MRIRLQVFLPFVVGVLVAGGFLVAALAVRSAVGDGPGGAAAVRSVLVWGAVGVAVGVAVAIGVTRMIVVPLQRVERAATRLGESEEAAAPEPAVAEIRAVARGITRAAGELRDRHGREIQERSELAALVDAVSEGIVQLGAEGRVVRANPAARSLLGLPVDSPGRALGALVRNVELRRLLERGIRGEETAGAEVLLDDRRILVSVSPQEGGGAVATFVDLTDLRRLEEIRRDFVANASHELKTPLTSIRGYAETLLSGDLPAAEREQFLATIARNAERLQRIVDDLLDLSRLEAGRWEPDLEAVDVLRIAESCWLSFADRAADQGVSFSVEADGDARALADARALEQVFANLFDNALRYTSGDGRIGVGSTVRDAPPANRTPGPRRPAPGRDPGPWVVVEVADTGAGIPRDAIPRIFERFYRVDPARSRAEGGTGLGLSIVKHMVESMGGGLDARSELGRGTVIRLWLPAAR